MIKKLYVKVKKKIVDNHNFLLFLILFVIVLNIKVPYVISAPGGIIPLKNRVTINGSKVDNNFYTTYVKVYDGNVATFIVGKIMPRWDVEKEKEYTGSTNLTYEELNKYEKLMLKQSNLVATMLAFDEAGVKYEKQNPKVYVLYKYEEYDNDLKIGDQIISCNNNVVNTYNELTSCIKEDEDDSLSLDILRENKKLTLIVPLYTYAGGNIIGINIYEDSTIKSDINVDIKVDKDESGSSGGFMTALSIYDALSKRNLSKNLKIAGTGTIDESGNVGEIDGIKYKLLGASKKKVDIFFVPDANYKQALEVKDKYNLKLKIVKVRKFAEAIDYLIDLNK